jgi:hypothetical protein
MISIENDPVAMEAIACLREKGYSADEVSVAMKIISAPKPNPEDLPPWPIGTVVKDKATGYRYVLSRPLLQSDAYEFVCERAHEERPHPDYSYICNERYCRCRS